jgi:hypothetical protein
MARRRSGRKSARTKPKSKAGEPYSHPVEVIPDELFPQGKRDEALAALNLVMQNVRWPQGEAEFLENELVEQMRKRSIPRALTIATLNALASQGVFRRDGTMFKLRIITYLSGKDGGTDIQPHVRWYTSLEKVAQYFGAQHSKAEKPRWDSERRELWFMRQMWKRYTRPAPNQESILASFQELDWSSRIDDPLPPGKLRDTLPKLNVTFRESPLQFSSDGNGEGILWQVRSTSRSSADKQQMRSR